VVQLIQDLNGNHVIQKCLNRLSAEDAQFIFDAVGTNCVVVGTHRHGCCVLQRCIDHASGQQRTNLINHITRNAYSLVQDPFGNYVLQYIVDLKEPAFINPMVESFQGNIVGLSKHKFSSNVIEKMIRGAEPAAGATMVDEFFKGNDLESMLRDQYANYVVQTALDHVDTETRARLVNAIRPILPAVRQTPYGRRVQSKIAAADGQGSGRPETGLDPLSTRMTLMPSTPLSPQGEKFINSPNKANGGNGGFAPFSQMAFANGMNGMNGMSSMNSMFAASQTPTSLNGNKGLDQFSRGGSTFNPFANHMVMGQAGNVQQYFQHQQQQQQQQQAQQQPFSPYGRGQPGGGFF